MMKTMPGATTAPRPLSTNPTNPTNPITNPTARKGTPPAEARVAEYMLGEGGFTGTRECLLRWLRAKGANLPLLAALIEDRTLPTKVSDWRAFVTASGALALTLANERLAMRNLSDDLVRSVCRLRGGSKSLLDADGVLLG
jgi:hypothetical protein